jgi:hypothetical protein
MLVWFETEALHRCVRLCNVLCCYIGVMGICCSKIAEAEAAVSVNEKKWLVMHMHVQLQLDELRGPQTLGLGVMGICRCCCRHQQLI